MIAKLSILSIFCVLVFARSIDDTSRGGSKFNINDFLSSYKKPDSGSGSSFNIQDFIPNSQSGLSGLNNFNKPDGTAPQTGNIDGSAVSGDEESSGTDQPAAFNKEELIASLLGGQGQGSSKFDWQSLIANRPAKNRKNQED